MTEERIEEMFSPRDWNIGWCDRCCETNEWVVNIADIHVCRFCLEKYYSEDGELNVQ
jgi:hypothetical protein